MKKLFNKILALSISIALLSGCEVLPEYQSDWTGISSADSNYSEPISSDYSDSTFAPETTNSELTAAEITKAMGVGWNLGNQLEASINGIPSETAWGNPVITEDLIKAVRQAGFSTVRIPVSYLEKIGSAPDYIIDEAWLERIGEVVDYVIGNDMYAIINMHGDGYYTVDKSWLLCVNDNQDEIKAKYNAVWKQIAEKFADYDEHLVFESMNEEFDNTYGNPSPIGYENINAYNQIFVDTVRRTGGNNASRWLLIPGWNTNIKYTSSEYGFKIPDDAYCSVDDKRIMVSVHYYDPYNFTLDENGSATSQWGKYATSHYDNWGQEDYADECMQSLKRQFIDNGYPVVIGELGVGDKSHISNTFGEYRRYWYEYIVHSAKINGCIPIVWDNGWGGQNGLSLFDRNTYTQLHSDINQAIVRAISNENYDIPPVKS